MFSIARQSRCFVYIDVVSSACFLSFLHYCLSRIVLMSYILVLFLFIFFNNYLALLVSSATVHQLPLSSVSSSLSSLFLILLILYIVFTPFSILTLLTYTAHVFYSIVFILRSNNVSHTFPDVTQLFPDLTWCLLEASLAKTGCKI